MPVEKIHRWQALPLPGISKCNHCHLLRAKVADASPYLQDQINYRWTGAIKRYYAYSHDGYWSVDVVDKSAPVRADWVFSHRDCRPSVARMTSPMHLGEPLVDSQVVSVVRARTAPVTLGEFVDSDYWSPNDN